jgi:hypothetical protein
MHISQPEIAWTLSKPQKWRNEFSHNSLIHYQKNISIASFDNPKNI